MCTVGVVKIASKHWGSFKAPPARIDFGVPKRPQTARQQARRSNEDIYFSPEHLESLAR